MDDFFHGQIALLNTAGGPFIMFQSLDVLTRLGLVILIGTVVNNPILIVDRSLQLFGSRAMSLSMRLSRQSGAGSG